MEGFWVLLGLLILAWLFVLPLILLGMVISLRKRMNLLEHDILKSKPQRQSNAQEHISQSKPLVRETTRTAPQSTATPSFSPPVPPPLPKTEVYSGDTSTPTKSRILESTDPEPGQPAHPLAVFLQSIGMWPPKREGADREVLLLQWWLPRIGGLLAVLAALFFGAYVNQNANPLIRWLELAGSAVGISVLGLFFERKQQSFGSVLFVTGLVLCYLATVAAYALEPVKILHSPALGAILQAASLAIIVGAGLARRSPQIVNLAYAFSFFMLAFMAWTGLRDATYISAFLLLLAAPVLVHRYAFRSLMWIAIPLGAVALLAFPFIQEWRTPLLPSDVGTLLYLQAYIAFALGLRVFSELLNRMLLALALSLSLVAVFAVGRTYDVEVLELLAGVSGVHLVLWAGVAQWRNRPVAYELAFIKGCFLLAVWVILHWHGDLRWMVLALQALLISLAYRSRPSIWMEVACIAAIAVSGWFLSRAIESPPQGGSFLWWMMVIYPWVAILASSIVCGVWPKSELPRKDYAFLRIVMHALVACGAVSVWVHLAQNSTVPFAPSMLLASAPYACVAIALIPRIGERFAPLGGAALAYVVANVFYWDHPFSAWSLALVGICALAAGFWFSRRPAAKLNQIAEVTVWLFPMISLAAWLEQALQGWESRMVITFLIASGLIVVGSLARFRMLAILTVALPVLLAGTGMPLLALGAGFLWIGLGLFLSPLREQWLWSFLFALALLYAFVIQRFDGSHNLEWLTWQTTTAVAAFLLFLFARVKDLWGLWLGGIGFTGILIGAHHYGLVWKDYWNSDMLLSGALIVSLLIGVNLRMSGTTRRPRLKTIIDIVAAVLVFEVVYFTFRDEAFNVGRLLTPIAAATCFGMIILGIIHKNRSWRLTSLLLLLIPLCRLFLVDVQDAFYRIIAFGVAALLFVALGYIYHLIERRFGAQGS